MDIGIFSSPRTVDGLVAAARAAADDGFGSYWTSQIFSIDALTAIAVAAREVPGIRFGTGVVPIQTRHPMMLAGQALSVSQVSGGRLDLGIGLSHQLVVEGMWGLPFDKPVRQMREYLEALQPLLAGEDPQFAGETVTARGGLDVPAEAPPVLVAALGPQMLKVAGHLASATVTWMTGPQDHRRADRSHHPRGRRGSGPARAPGRHGPADVCDRGRARRPGSGRRRVRHVRDAPVLPGDARPRGDGGPGRPGLDRLGGRRRRAHPGGRAMRGPRPWWPPSSVPPTSGPPPASC